MSEVLSNSSTDTEPGVVSLRSIQLSILVSESGSDWYVIARTWREIRGTRMDKVEPEIQRLDDDGLKEPLSASSVPQSGHQRTLFEQKGVFFQRVDDSVDHLQGSAHREEALEGQGTPAYTHSMICRSFL